MGARRWWLDGATFAQVVSATPAPEALLDMVERIHGLSDAAMTVSEYYDGDESPDVPESVVPQGIQPR